MITFNEAGGGAIVVFAPSNYRESFTGHAGALEYLSVNRMDRIEPQALPLILALGI